MATVCSFTLIECSLFWFSHCHLLMWLDLQFLSWLKRSGRGMKWEYTWQNSCNVFNWWKVASCLFCHRDLQLYSCFYLWLKNSFNYWRVTFSQLHDTENYLRILTSTSDILVTQSLQITTYLHYVHLLCIPDNTKTIIKF